MMGRLQMKANVQTRSLIAGAVLSTLIGCATQTPPVRSMDSPQPQLAQRQAQIAVVQGAPSVPVLKRKVALGRITNETSYGRTLLRDKNDDPLGKQVSDILSKALVESGQFIVLE